MNSSGICQEDTANRIGVPKWIIFEMIEDLEQGDAYKVELDSLSMMYQTMTAKVEVQDTLISTLRGSLQVAKEGWSNAEDIISLKEKRVVELEHKVRKKNKILKYGLLGLVVAIIL